MKLGLIIRALRSQKAVTLETLALNAEVDASYLARIERGERNPSMEMLERIAKALGARVSTICALAEVDDHPSSKTKTSWDDSADEDLALRKQYLMLTNENRRIALELLKALARTQ